MGCITVVDHNNAEVSNLHRQIINTEGGKGTSKARYARDAMRSLNITVSVMAVTEPLNWDNAMDLVRGKDCVVDTSDNPCTQYLINDSCVLAGRELETAAITNGVSGRGGGPILLVSGSAMVTEGELTVYNHQGGGGGVLPMPIPQDQPCGTEKQFVFAADKGIIRKDGKVISDPVRTREE